MIGIGYHLWQSLPMPPDAAACPPGQAASDLVAIVEEPTANGARVRRPLRGIECRIIAPRRSNSAHLHRPWRATARQSTMSRPATSRCSAIVRCFVPIAPREPLVAAPRGTRGGTGFRYLRAPPGTYETPSPGLQAVSDVCYSHTPAESTGARTMTTSVLSVRVTDEERAMLEAASAVA